MAIFPRLWRVKPLSDNYTNISQVSEKKKALFLRACRAHKRDEESGVPTGDSIILHPWLPLTLTLQGAVAGILTEPQRDSSHAWWRGGDGERNSGHQVSGLIYGWSLCRARAQGRRSPASRQSKAEWDSPGLKLMFAAVQRPPAGNQDQLSLPLIDKQASE